jgi:hypothetical protein
MSAPSETDIGLVDFDNAAIADGLFVRGRLRSAG